MPGKYWTQEEEKKLLDMFAGGSRAEEIAETLGRRPGAVKQKMKRLGLLVVEKPRGRTTTRAILPADLFTHEQVLKILAGAMSHSHDLNLDMVEINRLNTLG